VRTTLAIYVDEWLLSDPNKITKALQDEHTANLRIIVTGLQDYLKNVDFFEPLDRECDDKCNIVFKAPGACRSGNKQDSLDKWQRLFTSYVSYDTLLIKRLLQHPDYKERFVETTNRAARRLANFDLSCATGPDDEPSREALYADVLVAFIQNQLNYTRARAEIESDDVRNKRLEVAENAAQFGLEMTSPEVRKVNEGRDRRFLKRIEPNDLVDAQANLTSLRSDIAQLKRELGQSSGRDWRPLK
jgi:hypothetical protein